MELLDLNSHMMRTISPANQCRVTRKPPSAGQGCEAFLAWKGAPAALVFPCVLWARTYTRSFFVCSDSNSLQVFQNMQLQPRQLFFLSRCHIQVWSRRQQGSLHVAARRRALREQFASTRFFLKKDCKLLGCSSEYPSWPSPHATSVISLAFLCLSKS